MTVCRSCGALIVWALTPAGKRIPLDRDPVDGGNIRLGRGDNYETLAVVVSPGEGTHVTCPHAEQHRGGTS